MAKKRTKEIIPEKTPQKRGALFLLSIRAK